MSREYTRVVLAEYERKKLSGELSVNLLDPTPGNIREECLATYGKNDQAKDDAVLRLFFGQSKTKNGYLDALENSRAEKFKQMPRILNGNVPKPGLKYVELLAWLIDFSPRPSTCYHFELQNNLKEGLNGRNSQQAESNEEINENKGNDELETDKKTNIVLEEKTKTITSGHQQLGSQENDKPTYGIKKINFMQYAGIAAFLAAIIIFVCWISASSQSCMYWNGSEYKVVNCNEQVLNAQVIALDKQKLAHFKKITQPDTITFNSLKKVWYSKINNEVEFFTARGKHPLQSGRILKPVTAYILGKYGNTRMVSLINTSSADTIARD